MSQSLKATKSKKSSTREREKRKSVTGNLDSNSHSNIHEKSSTARESHSKKYAGLSWENIKAAAEHIEFPELFSQQICEIVAEDLNYKLRYIISQAANRSIICNRTSINSDDIEETFSDLTLDKVYGATSDPIWKQVPDDQNYLYLDDQEVDVFEEAEAELSYHQPADPIIVKGWLPERNEPSESMKNYFKIICESLVSEDVELRRMALQNVSANRNIGPIIEWFYRFGYILLSKDVNYDCLTLYALDLIETLEMSPIGSTGVSENQLKLIVRLILQRLLKSFTNPDVLKPMCWVLAILCRRHPLRDLVMTKLKQKMPILDYEFSLPLLMILNSLGIDAVVSIFLENVDFFLTDLLEYRHTLHGSAVLETYHILYKYGIYDTTIQNEYLELKDFMVILYRPFLRQNSDEKLEIDFFNMKKNLIKTRRKIESNYMKKFVPFENVFEAVTYRSRMKCLLEEHYKMMHQNSRRKQTHIVVGKMAFLVLPQYRRKNSVPSKCSGHSLFSYNL